MSFVALVVIVVGGIVVSAAVVSITVVVGGIVVSAVVVSITVVVSISVLVV